MRGVRLPTARARDLSVALILLTLTASGAAAAPAHGASLRAVLGRTVIAKAVGGRVFVKTSARARRVRLRKARAIPIGSIVDTSKGRVKLTSAKAGGGTQSGVFYEGAFVVRQDKTGLTDLALTGDLSGCAAGGPHRPAAARRGSSTRRLWGSARGKFRTGGRYTAATVRGTTWLTEDHCNATETETRQGKVLVTARGPLPLTLEVDANETVDLFCTDKGPAVAPKYCLYVNRTLMSSSSGVNFFAGFLKVRGATATTYDLCLTYPGQAEQCAEHPFQTFADTGDQGALFLCDVSLPGQYVARWKVAGTTLSPTLVSAPFPTGSVERPCIFA